MVTTTKLFEAFTKVAKKCYNSPDWLLSEKAISLLGT